MWGLKPFSIYALCSQEKNYVFSMWDLKPISIYASMLKKKKLFFQCGIWSNFVYILYVHKKKNYVFSMWDLKPISIYTPMFPRKSYVFNVGFEAISYIYFMFTWKKLCFFNVR
jgi:hypothetical protein